MAEDSPTDVAFPLVFSPITSRRGENESGQHGKVDQLIEHLLLYCLFLPEPLKEVVSVHRKPHEEAIRNVFILC